MKMGLKWKKNYFSWVFDNKKNDENENLIIVNL